MNELWQNAQDRTNNYQIRKWPPHMCKLTAPDIADKVIQAKGDNKFLGSSYWEHPLWDWKRCRIYRK
jgi:hypothetical protein